MSGLYLHIPFCRQACRYCDFHFTVSLRYMDEFVDCLVREIALNDERPAPKGSASLRQMETLYFGGGTPSLLSVEHMEKILGSVRTRFGFSEGAEWTIECNPEDLERSFLTDLKGLGFNRLSIGVQSFVDRDLELMRRSHNASTAEHSVEEAHRAGFENINIDLIYGIPGQSRAEWKKNLERAVSLPVSHLSAYHLTFEPGTVFEHWRKKGRIVPVHERESEYAFRILRETMGSAGFGHYEISNFARDGNQSHHNMIYWSGKSYMGLGPSAHSYDGSVRSWNKPSLKAYLEGMRNGQPEKESETLGPSEHYHDYLITSLRTSTGADPGLIGKRFGKNVLDHFQKESDKWMKKGTLEWRDRRVVIRPESWLLTDLVLKELFLPQQERD